MTTNTRPLDDDAIQLHNCDIAALMDRIEPGTVDCVHVDPPWAYENWSEAKHGAAANHYDGLSMPEIAGHCNAAYKIAKDDAYMVVWCTFPKLMEWSHFGLFSHGWQYITGGAWGKTNGLGVGFHVRGDSELALLYRKGNPKPNATISNLWLAPRTGHSEKPQTALRALVRMTTPVGGLALDLYAGASGSCARACRAEGRRYEGAEIDPARYSEALRRLGLEEQYEMELEAAR